MWGIRVRTGSVKVQLDPVAPCGISRFLDDADHKIMTLTFISPGKGCVDRLRELEKSSRVLDERVVAFGKTCETISV